MHQAGGLGPEEAAALRAALAASDARAAAAEAKVSDDAALIAHLKLQIAKLQRDRFGQRSERTQRLLDQYELQLEELEASATVDELRAEMAAAKTTNVEALTDAGPRASPSPTTCPASGSSCPRRLPAPAAAGRAYRSWARTSPRRWRQSRVNGR